MRRRTGRRPAGDKSTTRRARVLRSRFAIMRCDLAPTGAFWPLVAIFVRLRPCNNAWPRPNKGSSGNTHASGTPKSAIDFFFSWPGKLS